MFTASRITRKGYYHYCFQDFVALRTIYLLKKQNITTNQIKKAFRSLKKKFPDVQNPFVQKPVVVTGGRIAIVQQGKVYDALSGQMLIIDIDEIEMWVNDIEKNEKEVSFEHDNDFELTPIKGVK